MTIDHEVFAEANQPPPERATETPEVEASPEAEPPLDAVANVDGVEVACRLEEGTRHRRTPSAARRRSEEFGL